MRGLLTVGLIAKAFDVLLLGITSIKYPFASKQVQAPHPSAALWETAAATFPQGKAGRKSALFVLFERLLSF